MIKISTKSMRKAKGIEPMKTSLSEMFGSFRVPSITKQEMPKGGVSNPISAPMTVTKKKQAITYVYYIDIYKLYINIYINMLFKIRRIYVYYLNFSRHFIVNKSFCI